MRVSPARNYFFPAVGTAITKGTTPTRTLPRTNFSTHSDDTESGKHGLARLTWFSGPTRHGPTRIGPTHDKPPENVDAILTKTDRCYLAPSHMVPVQKANSPQNLIKSAVCTVPVSPKCKAERGQLAMLITPRSQTCLGTTYPVRRNPPPRPFTVDVPHSSAIVHCHCHIVPASK